MFTMAKWRNQTRPGNTFLMETNDQNFLNNYAEDNLSILPIDKDGIGVCQRCGKIDIKSRLYANNGNFCNKICARLYGVFNGGSNNQPNPNKASRCGEFWTRKQRSHRFVLMDGSHNLEGMIPMEPLPQLAKPWLTDLDNFAQPISSKLMHVTDSYEWSNELFGCDFLAAPVKLFQHAPLSEMWDETFEGMKVEVRNKDCDHFDISLSDYFWVATIIKVKGYMGMLRYEGFGSDDSKDFWVNLCCSEVHQVGWCATRGKPLIPPKSIEGKYSDWKRFLVKQLTGARTLPANFYMKFSDSLKSRFEPGMLMEVVDKNCISQVKVANVVEIIGKRLHVKYYDNTPDDMGFWCHEDSPLIHPVGWAFGIGHTLDAPEEYAQRVKIGIVDGRDATICHFNLQEMQSYERLFVEGMKLEAIDPLNLSSVCAATVMRVLGEGYMMIRVDCYPADVNGADWFCYHQRSPCIFPVGFCTANNIPLTPPIGYDINTFDWEQYLEQTEAIAAGPELFTSTQCRMHHGFVAGMKLECADLMDPRLVCVATIARVVGNLLKVHFDGWGDEYDQWLGGGSTDVYPVGWCRAVGHKLEGPNKPIVPPPKPKPKKATRKKKLHHPILKTVNKTNNEEATPSRETSTDKDTTTNDSKYPTEDSSQSPSNDIKVETSPVVDSVESESCMEETAAGSAEGCTEESAVGSADGCTEESALGSADGSTEVTNPVENESDSIPAEADDFSVKEEADETEATEEASPLKEAEQLPAIDDDIDLGTMDDLIEEASNDVEEKVIPRLVGNTTVSTEILSVVDPESWSPADVSKFLAVNDCSPYCVHFSRIDGKCLLDLTKDKIIELLEMKVGPSLKIFDLINQLKCKLKPVQSRLKTNFK